MSSGRDSLAPAEDCTRCRLLTSPAPASFCGLAAPDSSARVSVVRQWQHDVTRALYGSKCSCCLAGSQLLHPWARCCYERPMHLDFTAADVHRQTDARTSDLLALLLEVLKQFDDKLLQVFPGFACQLADNRRALQTQEAASVHRPPLVSGKICCVGYSAYFPIQSSSHNQQLKLEH